jgi:tetratricopeptide (TPR) repeat protein/transcriptional regulator with XRE-family HTH domain
VTENHRVADNGGDALGALFRGQRERAGLTQEQVAERAGLSVRTIRNIEAGARRPRAESVRLLAEALQLPSVRAAPGQLPPDPRGFSGRANELRELDGLLADADGTAGTLVISAIAGTAGVGKTALAVRWAHRVADHFPDGQLYVDLRGYGPDEPMSAGDVLASFLHALGVRGENIPLAIDERAALYRTEMASRRLLVVLDNASSVEQVRPLLPGSRSLVLVTSRDSLAGLVARDGAHRLDLDLLAPADAEALLSVLIGDRVHADPGAAASLAAQCARLPLALRVAAELAAARPRTALADLVAELADEQRRLDLLDAGGDPRTAVRAVLSWSYRQLPPPAARAFRLLGLHPGRDVDRYTVAALTELQPEEAWRLLDRLAHAHLVQLTAPARYGMHDLLRAYAAHLTHSDDAKADRDAALTRLFDHYLHSAAAAMNTLHPAERHRRPQLPDPPTAAAELTEPSVAQAWLDTERPNLAAAIAYQAEQGWPGHATQLAAVLFRYLDTGGYFTEALDIHTHALRAARHAGDRSRELDALINLGGVYWRQGDYERSVKHVQAALTISRQVADRAVEARALHNLGLNHYRLGAYQQAAQRHRQAMAICQETGDRTREAEALSNLGIIDQRLGQYQQAAYHLQQAIAICQETGDRTTEADALDNLGIVHQRLGQYEQAAQLNQRAIARHREAGIRAAMAEPLINLGELRQRQSRYDLAVEALEEALTIAQEMGDRGIEAAALNGLGTALRATGRLDAARARHASAQALAEKIGDRYELARAYAGIASVRHDAGQAADAQRSWGQALALYCELGVPEADEIRGRLADLTGSDGGSVDDRSGVRRRR